jgi:catalase
LDATKTIDETDYPLIEVGTLTLNTNPTNFFAENEQIAFNPSTLVPGIEPSNDKVLQGRLLIYKVT